MTDDGRRVTDSSSHAHAVGQTSTAAEGAVFRHPSSVARLDSSQLAVLIGVANRARESAYAPYSKYPVGAAVLSEDDRVFVGCNVENASYGLSLCAERATIASAVAAGVRRIRAVVVVTGADPPGTPCGACRQWMAEFGDNSLEVIAANPAGSIRRFTLGELLPEAFRL